MSIMSPLSLNSDNFNASRTFQNALSFSADTPTVTTLDHSKLSNASLVLEVNSDVANALTSDVLPAPYSEMLLPALCQLRYVFPECAPLHMDLHVEFRIKFYKGSL